MRLPILLLSIGFLSAHATGISQSITISGKKASLEKVFALVEKQTGYVFLYTEQMLKDARPVTINAANMPLIPFLTCLFKDQPLEFTIKSKSIILSRKKVRTISEWRIETGAEKSSIAGRVLAEDGTPLVGATVTIKGTNRSVVTTTDSRFILIVEPGEVLVVTYIGYTAKEITITPALIARAKPVDFNSPYIITLTPKVNVLDETIIKGYYTTSRRLNTGSVSKITAADIEKQPVTNPLLALQGRIPGMTIIQDNGLPGSDISIRIRGTNSLAQGSAPLFVIDGVPMASATGYFAGNYEKVDGSVFNNINPANIQSIEVLKDADATAIYGSRGANGVVLITTKKGRAGRISVGFNATKGISVRTYTPKMLNTEQYLALRKEAFRNDGVTPTALNAPDLTVWDSTRSTDWVKDLSGHHASRTDLQASITGGSETLQLLISGGYHYESTPLLGDFSFRRGDLHISANQQSLDKKFQSSIAVGYSSGVNNLIGFADALMYSLLALPPNAPDQRDANGKLIWTQGIVNPYTYLMQTQNDKTNNLSGSIAFSYQLLKSLQVKVNAGVNNTRRTTIFLTPAASREPNAGPNQASIGNANARGWSVEPQLVFQSANGPLKIDATIGTTLQSSQSDFLSVSGANFPNDALVGNMTVAGTISVVDEGFQYRYQAVFGRAGLNWENKYILNLTGRRDGSSRFGPGRQFANFGAVGAAWVFTKEKWFNNIPVLSFGKLRTSYGTTGNDQIGEYKFLDTWSGGGGLSPWFGSSGLLPDQLFNPDYAWEKNQKMDIAMDIGLWNDRLLLSVNYYRNESSRQLLSMPLPTQTGFNTVVQNRNAKLRNTGWEFEIRSNNIQQKDLKWSTSLQFSITRDKLVAYPGISGTNLTRKFVVGKPLGAGFGYHYLGVDPQTGVYQFLDRNKDGKISFPDDDGFLNASGRKPVSGGLINSVTWKNLQVDIHFSFTTGYGSHNKLQFLRVGEMKNLPVDILDLYWKKPGDQSLLQKASATPGSPANTGFSLYSSSDGDLRKSTFIRLQNVSLSYRLPEKVQSKLRLKDWRVFAQAQNLLTIAPFSGKDPAMRKADNIPPLLTITGGLQFSF